jgi:hypothetical protein
VSPHSLLGCSQHVVGVCWRLHGAWASLLRPCCCASRHCPLSDTGCPQLQWLS